MEYSDEYLNKVCDSLNQMKKSDWDSLEFSMIDYLQNNNYEGEKRKIYVDIDGKSDKLEFEYKIDSDQGRGDKYLICTTFQKNPTDKTIACQGEFSSWSDKDWGEFKIIQPKEVYERKYDYGYNW